MNLAWPRAASTSTTAPPATPTTRRATPAAPRRDRRRGGGGGGGPDRPGPAGRGPGRGPGAARGGAGDEVAHLARGAVERLVAAGAVEVKVELPHIDLALPVGAATFTVEGAVSVEAHLAAGRPMSPSVRVAFDMARGIPATTFVKAQ